MADDDATDVLITLVVIAVLVFIFFLMTVLALVLRWKKDKTSRDLKLRYSYGPEIQTTSFILPEQTDNTSHFVDMYPNTFSYVARDEYNDNPTKDLDYNKQHFERLEVPQRISTISGKSVDIGNLSGVSEFVLNPAVVSFRKKETYGEYMQRNSDSMRSSAGVDLGADYHKGIHTAKKVYWEDRHSVKIGRVGYSDVPVVLFGTKAFDSQFGKKRRKGVKVPTH